MLEKRKDDIASSKVPITSYRRAIAKPLPPIPAPKTSPSVVQKERSYITCNQQFCDSIARYYCWTCKFYVCNKHKMSHNEDDGHDLARVMVCDVCKTSKRISLQKVDISMHKARYLCDRCLNKYASEVGGAVQKITGCKKCKEEEVDILRSKFLCRHCHAAMSLKQL